MNYLTGFLIVVLSFGYTQVQAQKKIDKDNCTITLENGKTFKLYGRVKIVENFEDIRVKVVENFEDIDVKIVENFEHSCGLWKLVDNFQDIRVKLVNSGADVEIKFTDNFPGIR